MFCVRHIYVFLSQKILLKLQSNGLQRQQCVLLNVGWIKVNPTQKCTRGEKKITLG